jgi:hypothetical protein
MIFRISPHVTSGSPLGLPLVLGDHSMNAEQIRSLTRVLDYLAQDEESHFESASPEERTNHIYLDVLILQDFLEKQ